MSFQSEAQLSHVILNFRCEYFTVKFCFIKTKAFIPTFHPLSFTGTLELHLFFKKETMCRGKHPDLCIQQFLFVFFSSCILYVLFCFILNYFLKQSKKWIILVHPQNCTLSGNHWFFQKCFAISRLFYDFSYQSQAPYHPPREKRGGSAKDISTSSTNDIIIISLGNGGLEKCQNSHK